MRKNVKMSVNGSVMAGHQKSEEHLEEAGKGEQSEFGFGVVKRLVR